MHAILKMDPQITHVSVIAADGTREFALPLGTSTVAALFRRDPPEEGEVELAIQVVEDALMPIARGVPAGAALYAGDPLTREVARMAAGSEAQVATLTAVESLFGELASAAQRGDWPSASGLDRSRSAALLIVREFMHHAGFRALEVNAQDEA